MVGIPDDDNDIRVDNSSNRVSMIKVLIYDGDGSMEDSVAGLKACLDECNSRNSTGYYFDYDLSDKINSNTLSSYDVLIMPGGNADKYLKNGNIDSEAIKQFLSRGNGYVGICAGAYVASSNVDGTYSGWGLAPHVNTVNVNYEGYLSISPTGSGNSLLKSTSITLYHQNGPALYESTSGATSFAVYMNNETGYSGYSAIIGDNYGSGRVLLSGPHPEIDPQDETLLARMIMWAAK